jgi:RimJ/RimL family protein N-acetyltransferase
MKVGPKLKRTVVLDDGKKVVVRCIRPADRDALRAAFHALAPETRYQRFMGHFSDLTPAMLTYLTEVDGHDHVAIIAVPAGRTRGTPLEILAVARFIRLRDDATSAEVAVTVSDALQGLGLGTQLLELLALAAKERGIDKLVAHVLDGNAPMKRILAKSGPVTSTRDGAVAVTLVTPDERKTPTALARALAWLRWPRRAA